MYFVKCLQLLFIISQLNEGFTIELYCLLHNPEQTFGSLKYKALKCVNKALQKLYNT